MRKPSDNKRWYDKGWDDGYLQCLKIMVHAFKEQYAKVEKEMKALERNK